MPIDIDVMHQNARKEALLDATSAAVPAFSFVKASGDTPTGTKALVAALAAQTAKLIGVGSEVEVGKPLASCGLDSLSVVELRDFI